jgi:hypothetical protein
MMYPDDRRWPFIVLDPEFSRQMTWRPENLSEWATTEESELAPDGRTLTYRSRLKRRGPAAAGSRSRRRETTT